MFGLNLIEINDFIVEEIYNCLQGNENNLVPFIEDLFEKRKNTSFKIIQGELMHVSNGYVSWHIIISKGKDTYDLGGHIRGYWKSSKLTQKESILIQYELGGLFETSLIIIEGTSKEIY